MIRMAVRFTNDVLAEHNLRGYVFGHAGDGNLHVNIIYDGDSESQLEVVLAGKHKGRQKAGQERLMSPRRIRFGGKDCVPKI